MTIFTIYYLEMPDGGGGGGGGQRPETCRVIILQ
jgi:hypothetical protein